MAPKALCGRLITSRRSFLALAWTLTTFLSLFSFIVAIFLATRITQQYTTYSAGYYNGGGNRYLQEEEEDNNSRDGSHSNDERNDEDFFASLTHNSRGLLFASVYTTILGLGLSLYGSTVVIGFMSLVGEYIPPCFNFRNMSMIGEEEDPSTIDPALGPRKLWAEKIHRGVFLGSLVIFSNLLILCAVIFGELQVNDNNNDNDDDNNIFQSMFSYRVERITSVFAATCMVLAFLYISFAVLYLTCGGMTDDNDDVDGYSSSMRSNTKSNSRGILENSLFEMPKKRRRRKHRSRGRSTPDKQEPLVGDNERGMIPPVGITNNEGFITDVNGLSNESSNSDWHGAKLPELT